MKILLPILMLLSLSIQAAELAPDELETLKDKYKGQIKVGGVNDSTAEDANDNKVEVIKLHTIQDEREQLKYALRIIVELTDKNKETCYAELTTPQPRIPSNYTGESDWEFQIPHGSLKRPKISAYVIQYGFMHNGTFVAIAEETDDVDAADEITERTKTKTSIELTDHQCWYRE